MNIYHPSAFMDAIKKDDVDKMDELIADGYDPFEINPIYGVTLVMSAAHYMSPKILKRLIDIGVDFKSTANNLFTPLHSLCHLNPRK